MVRDGAVNAGVVSRRAPLDAACDAARPNLLHPDYTAVIRVQGPVLTALLTSAQELNQPTISSRKKEVRARTKIVIGALARIGLGGDEASHNVPRVSALQSLPPFDGASHQIERYYGIYIIIGCQITLSVGRVCGNLGFDGSRNGVVVSCCDVERAALDIYNWCAALHRAAGVAQRDHITLPDQLASNDIQRDDLAAR